MIPFAVTMTEEERFVVVRALARYASEMEITASEARVLLKRIRPNGEEPEPTA